MITTTVAIALLVASILIRLGMILYFLWSVYDRGGPTHVIDVARALRQVYDPELPTKLIGYMQSSDSDNSEKEDEDPAVAKAKLRAGGG